MPSLSHSEAFSGHAAALDGIDAYDEGTGRLIARNKALAKLYAEEAANIGSIVEFLSAYSEELRKMRASALANQAACEKTIAKYRSLGRNPAPAE